MKKGSLKIALAFAGALTCTAAHAEDLTFSACTTDGKTATIKFTVDAPSDQERAILKSMWDRTVTPLTASELASDKGFGIFAGNYHDIAKSFGKLIMYENPIVGSPRCSNAVS